MSKKLEPPLWIDVKQSHILLTFIIVGHILVIINCLLVPISLALKVLFLMVTACSLYFYLQRYFRGYYSLSLRYTEGFGWELEGHEDFINMRVLRSTVLTSFIIILHVEIDHRLRSILICKDAVTSEEFRQAFVALKIMQLE